MMDSPYTEPKLEARKSSGSTLVEEALEAALDEQVFEASAVEAMDSARVRSLLKRAAEKSGSADAPATK